MLLKTKLSWLMTWNFGDDLPSGKICHSTINKSGEKCGKMQKKHSREVFGITATGIQAKCHC